jgi:hypothetical protein
MTPRTLGLLGLVVGLVVTLGITLWHSAGQLNPALAATNPYVGGGCTEWAWQRWYDVNGSALPSNLGNAKDWAANADGRYSVGTVARARSIAVFPPGTNYRATDYPRHTDPTNGHVAFVETVYSNGTFRTSSFWSPAYTSPDYVTFYPDSRIMFIYPPAPTPTPPPTTDGSLLKGSGNAIYVMKGGLKRHVPSGATFEAMGYRWSNVNVVANSVLASIPTGNPLLDVLATGNLLRGSGSAVYVMESGRKRHVAGTSVMSACGYGWDAVYSVSNSRLSAIPTGTPLNGVPCPRLSPPTGRLLQGSGNAVHVASYGLKRHIPSAATFEAMGYKWGNVNRLPTSSLAAVPTGTPLLNALADGNLLQGTGPAVYVMQGGTKRHVASPSVMSACGYERDAVRFISNARLSSIPSGASLTGPPCAAFAPPTGTLLQGSGTAVFVMDGLAKRHVASRSAFDACGYLWGNINRIADSTLNSMPAGTVVTAPPCP